LAPLGVALVRSVVALRDDIAAMNTVVALADHRGQIVRRYGLGLATRWLDRLGIAPGFVWSEDVLSRRQSASSPISRRGARPTEKLVRRS
jgi:hypothetical protein